MPFQWVTKDAWLIMAARGLRNFALGSIAIFMVIYLKELGFSLFQIGAFLSAGVAGSGIHTFRVGLVSDRLGRRWVLVGSTLLAGFAGLSLMFFNDFLMLAIFAVLGGGRRIRWASIRRSRSAVGAGQPGRCSAAGKAY
jgi:MFS family permease